MRTKFEMSDAELKARVSGIALRPVIPNVCAFVCGYCVLSLEYFFSTLRTQHRIFWTVSLLKTTGFASAHSIGYSFIQHCTALSYYDQHVAM